LIHATFDIALPLIVIITTTLAKCGLHRTARRKSRIHAIHGSREIWSVPWILAFTVIFHMCCIFISKSINFCC